MKFKLVEEIVLNERLQPQQSYMLRNDGKLILSDDNLHCYFKYASDGKFDDTKTYMRLLKSYNSNNLLWFYKNTQYDYVKKDIEQYVASIKAFDDDYKELTGEFNIYYDKYWDVIDTSNSTILSHFSDIEKLFDKLNNELNQEFCRVRTSDLYIGKTNEGGIYFRISSKNFNWFDLIWTLVYDNKNQINNVTICTDEQTTGKPLKYYRVNGKEINQMNIDEFINLSGNPIIEKYKDIIEDIYSQHSNLFYKNVAYDRLEENFDW